MGINKKDETIAALVKENSELAKAALQMAAAQAAIMQSFLDMWKPPAGKVNAAESLDERLFKREEADATDWEPLSEDIFAQLDRDIDIPKEFLT